MGGHVEEIAGNVWAHRVVAEGYPTVSIVTFTESRTFVVDTLMKPQDMHPVLDLLLDRSGTRHTVVVNTHHHWDHVYGNAAFPGDDIVAQRACPRLIQAQGTSADESVPLQPKEGVRLPNITFGDRLTFVDEDETVHLIHTPGHSEDSLVVFLANAGVLLGGDTVEWPLPNFAQRDGKEAWVRSLRQLKQLPVDLIVPSHGPSMGKVIIDANERYIVGVYEAVAKAKNGGHGRNDLNLPVEQFVDDAAQVDDGYVEAHRKNLLWAWDES
jgi:glyoxylase-like metal-dependent hydrolase (beta-lactamase superfamily II)